MGRRRTVPGSFEFDSTERVFFFFFSAAVSFFLFKWLGRSLLFVSCYVSSIYRSVRLSCFIVEAMVSCTSVEEGVRAKRG